MRRVMRTNMQHSRRRLIHRMLKEREENEQFSKRDNDREHDKIPDGEDELSPSECDDLS